MHAINFFAEIAVLAIIANVIRWLIFKRTTPLLLMPAKWKLVLLGVVSLAVGALPWRLEHLDEGLIVSLCALTVYLNVRSLLIGRGKSALDSHKTETP